jgi:O-acetylserine/cysteine efflux transporter
MPTGEAAAAPLPSASAAQGRGFGPADLLAIVTMNVMMGMNMVAMKFVIMALGPFTTSVVRFACVFLLCAPWLLKDRARWRLLALFGLVNGVALSALMNLALKFSANVGALSIVAQLSIPFSVVLGVVLLREKLTVARLAGATLAFVGVAAMLFDPRIANDLLGVCLMAGGALSWAFSSLLQRRLAGAPVLTLYAWTGLMAFLVLSPVTAVLEPHLASRVLAAHWTTAAWLAFTIVGVTLVGQGSLAWLLRHHPVSVIMPLTLAAPVVSVAAAYLFFGSPVTVSMVLGGAMVLGGIAVVMSFGARSA